MRDRPVTSNTPFDWLPAELIARIFQFLVDDQPPRSTFWRSIEEKLEANNTHQRPRTPKHRRAGPLLAAAVCQRWRSISFLEPRLWSNIHLLFKEFLEDGSEDKLLHQWLRRTGSLPISVSIAHYPYVVRSDRDQYYSREKLNHTFNTLVGTISHNAARIRNLYLNCTCKWGAHHFSYVPLIAEFLKEGMQVSALQGFQHSCHPRSVHLQFNQVLQILTEGRESHDPSKIHGYRALRNISIRGRVNELYALFTFFPCLENIDFSILRHDWSRMDGVDRPTLHLPYLKSLRVAYPSLPEECSLRWDKISLPSLQYLSIVMHEAQHSMSVDTVNWPMIHSCVKSCLPPLLSFAVDLSGVVPDDEFIDMLSCIPTLQRLYVRSCQLQNQITDRFWMAFAQKGKSGQYPTRIAKAADVIFLSLSVCPLLQTLVIDTPSKHKLVEVANAVVSRVVGHEDKSQGFLERIRINHCDFNQENFNCYPGIQQCREAGAVIEVSQWIPGRPPFPPNRRQRELTSAEPQILDDDLDLESLGNTPLEHSA